MTTLTTNPKITRTKLKKTDLKELQQVYIALNRGVCATGVHSSGWHGYITDISKKNFCLNTTINNKAYKIRLPLFCLKDIEKVVTQFETNTTTHISAGINFSRFTFNDYQQRLADMAYLYS